MNEVAVSMGCPIEEIKQRLDGTPSCFMAIVEPQIKQRERAIPVTQV